MRRSSTRLDDTLSYQSLDWLALSDPWSHDFSNMQLRFWFFLSYLFTLSYIKINKNLLIASLRVFCVPNYLEPLRFSLTGCSNVVICFSHVNDWWTSIDTRLYRWEQKAFDVIENQSFKWSTKWLKMDYFSFRPRQIPLQGDYNRQIPRQIPFRGIWGQTGIHFVEVHVFLLEKIFKAKSFFFPKTVTRPLVNSDIIGTYRVIRHLGQTCCAFYTTLHHSRFYVRCKYLLELRIPYEHKKQIKSEFLYFTHKARVSLSRNF